ncbi:MAG: AAA-like domain-containing protein [Stigonema ocellatum SAG 48.90 = DSM 106950]|nr:AAA-like domain-containing protein [Stigonema ocellatum SAG 48.90 = DSM 106950]
MTYTFGGTVQAGGGVYIPRRADDELLKLCQDAIFSYVLTPRQMGKSSLMVSTAQTLQAEGIQAVIVDLQELGAQVTAEQWYFGFLVKLDDQLMFETDVISWWQQHEHLGVSQRLTLFFEKVLLAEVTQKVVIFVDEIDSTLSLDFTDDFFTAVRYLYVARATNPEFHRLSFVLMGVATPGDLIRDAKRTPFNIGQRVDLTDFTFDEALPLAYGLGLPDTEALQVLRWVLKWTGGHPYLTQRLCGAVVKALTQRNVATPGSSPRQSLQVSLTEKELDQIVSSSFFGVMSEQDNNLQFVRDMLTKRAPQGLEKEVLSVYRHIHRGKRKVVDEEQSLVKSHLKLSGVVRRHGNTLVVRNGIYRHVFDQHWIWEHLPENLWQRLKPALPLIATLSVFSILMAVLAQYAFDRTREAEKETHEAQKQKANAQLFAQSLTSENLLISGGNDIEALIEGLKAAQKLNKLGKDAEEDNRMRVLANLQQVVYGVHERNRLEGHSSYVWGVAFSPDGKTIATASSDNTVKLWNLSGQPLQTLKGHSSRVNSVAFSPDGKTIATASGDNTVKLWNLNLENLLTLGCGWLQGYLISHPETLEELEQCQNQNKSLLIVAADSLVTQGEKLAQDGDFEGAVAKFKKANAWKPKLVINPEVKAAPAYVTQAKEKAKDGDLTGTIAKLKQAQQLDPKVDLDPDTQAVKNNPEAVAKKLVAPALIQQGEELAKQGDVKKGIEKYTEAQKLDSTLKISAQSWQSICFGGSLYNQAADVMFACEKAVALASKKEEASAKAVRGLAKALAGDKKGAIADFEVYIQSKDISAEGKKQVQGWVDALRVGKNPFTPEVLKKLRSDG